MRLVVKCVSLEAKMAVMTENVFDKKSYVKQPVHLQAGWKAPSNIALVKYWGKHGRQLPMNTSVSFTLSNCHTQTRLSAERRVEKRFEFEVLLDGEPAPSFKPKIQTFFERIGPYVGFLEDYRFVIDTRNSFPHSSGIASSASGMSALALCLLSLEQQMLETPLDQAGFLQKASFLARLGSGSACRSIQGPLVAWGQHDAVAGSSDLYGTTVEEALHPVFLDYQDCILLVDKGQKQVSSSVGHGLMKDHPYAQQRFATANGNVPILLEAMKRGELDDFVGVVESEALQLHAMMMTSMPYFILMKPATLEIINRVWRFRADTGIQLCFTLDAGANVHLLYPARNSEAVLSFIQTELITFCAGDAYIEDHTGLGARELN